MFELLVRNQAEEKPFDLNDEEYAESDQFKF